MVLLPLRCAIQVALMEFISCFTVYRGVSRNVLKLVIFTLASMLLKRLNN